jgi:PBP1b-binding outer membrane lipoprotein LpoB
MKKIIFTIMAASLLIAGCGPSASEKKEIEKLEAEAIELDSISDVIETAKQDLEDTAKELDELINEL